MLGTHYSLEVRPVIPQALDRLPELAENLLYSWDRRILSLFFRLGQDLWENCGHNPKLVLRRVSQERLEEAARDRIFMGDYHRALLAYDEYHGARGPGAHVSLDANTDLVAYFCAEFGFHESLPIYSGGLGILAGDHCKAASDLAVPFTAVGLLYRQGYFNQTIDGYGNQVAHYAPTNFCDLPITPVEREDGSDLRVQVELPGRAVILKVWRAQIGRIRLHLLDSDLPENSEADRSITYQLYGGDAQTRIQQEIVLGIGGVRALRALGLSPTVWHINEGHSAFQILERCREHVHAGMDFDTALELVASGTVFTTHTPVAAGHDIFDEQVVAHYFTEYARALKIPLGDFQSLGSSPSSSGGFNMTALALRGSRMHNGVSRIHGDVTASMEGYIWPQIPHDENPIGYVTNGVHVPTFLAREWANLLDMRLGGDWRNQLANESYWDHIDDIPDHSYWSLRQLLKSEMLEAVSRRVTRQYRRNGASPAALGRVTQLLADEGSELLILGFARRFATYKRATLLFEDADRLARLLNDPKRPVLLIFAGKAHPHDLPGQHFIRTIHEVSRRPEFEGKIILLEGYDLALARKLVTGVDVWLNTPEYPLEASGTSGQKAAINGVINLSILDGWWGEGYDGQNGWAIAPQTQPHDAAHRNHNEAKELMDILEQQVVPLYFDSDGQGYSKAWIRMSKNSMKSILPRFNAERMVLDYVRKYYVPTSQHGQTLARDQGQGARIVAAWKQRIARTWDKVHIRRLDPVVRDIPSGGILPIEVAVQLHDLQPADVIVECLVDTEGENGELVVRYRHPLLSGGTNTEGETLFRLDLKPKLPGLQHYRIRIYPHHALLGHPFETGCMLWV